MRNTLHQANEPGYYDRQGKPISLEQFSRLFSDSSYRFVGLDFVGDRVVATIWLGFDALFRGPQGGDLFETTVFQLTQDPNLGIRFDDSGRLYAICDVAPMRHYSTESDAQAGHRETVELVRRSF